jgi:type II secretory pathway component PulM
MGKTLAESAAEILAASVGKNQEPTKKLPGEVVDLGGATTENPGAEGEGKAASAAAKEAPKPTPKGDAKTASTPNSGPSGKAMAEETDEEVNLEDLSEEELDALLASLSEKELAALEESLEVSDEEVINELSEEELDEILASLSEEELAALAEEETVDVPEVAAAPVWEPINVKDMVKSNMVSMAEDVDALFNGESLSEEFRTKATTIFEAAVQARVEAVVEKIVVKNDEYLTATTDSVRNTVAEQVDNYLNYVVEEWMKANEVAVDTGLRAEIAEGFISGLKSLFAEHYIEVPEDKIDLVDELANNIEALQESLVAEQTAKAEVQKALNESKAQEILRKTCEGLTEVQVQKIKALAEGVEYTTEGEYTEKLSVIRENYFPVKGNKVEAPTAMVETSTPAETSAAMDYYVKSISKSLPR